MIKTLQEVTDEIVHSLFFVKDGEKTGDDKIKEILKEWANGIVDMCASSFEYSMRQGYRTINEIDEVPDGAPYPVLHRGSILRVKEMIK